MVGAAAPDYCCCSHWLLLSACLLPTTHLSRCYVVESVAVLYVLDYTRPVLLCVVSAGKHLNIVHRAVCHACFDRSRPVTQGEVRMGRVLCLVCRRWMPALARCVIM